MADSTEKEPRIHVEPDGLGDRARAFWAKSVAEYDLTDAEAELLAEAAWTLTEIESLRSTLDSDGLTVAGSVGQTRVHPAVNEIRQHRMALARLIKAIDLPADADEPESWTTKNARAAAEARWSMERSHG
jgi:hypothetical protein